MQYLVTGNEMNLYDSNTINIYGINPLVLMERAALAVVQELEALITADSRILCVCGTGNNGGDAYAAARLLYQKGIAVEILPTGGKEKMTEETKIQAEIAEKYGITVLKELPDMEYDIILDGIFGIGLSRAITGANKTLIEALNQKKAFRAAIDIPSGVHAGTGEVMGCALRADMTITFAYGKTGQYLYPGMEYCGRISICDIGIDEYSWNGIKPQTAYLEDRDLLRLPRRQGRANKGTVGKILIIAGSYNMAGAAYLSALAAYKTGCGMVRIYTQDENRVILQQLLPEALLTTFGGESFEEESLAKALAWADVALLGPGMGTGKRAGEIVQYVLKNAEIPLVIDADAINLIADKKELLELLHAPAIFTPHLKEMSRLCKEPLDKIRNAMVEFARKFSEKYQTVCVLKDARTVTAAFDGMTYINLSGNSGMATAGSGDVLAGVISALLAQGLLPKEAASLGVFLHGRAGDAMAEKKGILSLMASDLAEGIGLVTKTVQLEEWHDLV